MRIRRKQSKAKRYLFSSCSILPATPCIPDRRAYHTHASTGKGITAATEHRAAAEASAALFGCLLFHSRCQRLIVINTTAEDVCEYFDASSDRMDSMKGIILPRKNMTDTLFP